MSVPLNRAQRGRQSGSGLFAARGGGEGGHPVVEWKHGDRQTDRQTQEREEKVSTDLSRGTQLTLSCGEFSLSKGKYSLFFFWPMLCQPNPGYYRLT